jgi:DNA-binding transcriptional LysR family regulator
LDRFQEMQVFQAVAEELSFNRAARRLTLSAASVTRAVAGLEKRLGAKLLHRTTRGVRLSEAGDRFLADCRQLLLALEEAEAAAAASEAETRGTLSITASVLFGELFVTPLIVDFLAREPRVTIRALFEDRIVSMVDEGIDVAVRIGRLPDSGLSAKRVGQVRQIVCASPDHLARHGRPAHPRDLLRAPVIASSTSTLLNSWRFSIEGDPLSIHPTPRLVVSSNRAAIEAARRGAGFTRVLSYQVAGLVAAGELELVLEDFALEPIPVHVVSGGGRKPPAKIRAFVEHCVAGLKRHPELQ